MLTIMRKEFQVLSKEKGTFFWLVILPILFIVLFGSVFNSKSGQKLKIHYLDLDRSKVSTAFLANLGKIKGFALVNDSGLAEAEQIKKIKDGKLSALLVIPAGFAKELTAGRQAVVELHRDTAADATVEPVRMLLQNIAAGYREGKISGALAAASKNKQQISALMLPPVAVQDFRENARKSNMLDTIVPGYTVMFVFFIMIVITRGLIKEKESGMLARLRSTPMKPLDYLMGMWLTFIILVMIQCTTLLSVGHFIYKVSLGDITALSLIVIALAICGTGLGLGLALLVKSENQGVAVTQIITLGGAALGGLWFPYDLLPPAIQVIGHFTPQYWAQRGFQDVMFRGAHIGDVWQTPAVLLAFGAVGLTVALSRFKKFILEAAS